MKDVVLVIEVAANIIPVRALETMKERVFLDTEEFELGIGIDEMISRFSDGSNTHWVDEVVCMTIDDEDTNSQYINGGFSKDFWYHFNDNKQIMKKLLYDKIVRSLEVEFVQWLRVIKRDNRIDEIFRDKEKDDEYIRNFDFDKWIDENF